MLIISTFQIISTDEVQKLLDQYAWIELHLHHTWKPDHSNFNGSNHLALQQGMYNYHVFTNKWDNIAQHLTLCPDGKWVTGRPLSEMPISIKGHNKLNALAIEMIGNFDIGYDVLKGEQKKAILTIIKYFLTKNKAIKFHNEYSDKTCPGTSIIKSVLLQEATQLSDAIKEVKIMAEYNHQPFEIPEWGKEACEWAFKIGIKNGVFANIEEVKMMCYIYRYHQKFNQ